MSRPSISRLDAFTQSFKHFKDGFFKVVVKEGGRSYFFNADGSTKFPFSWTGNPWRYKDMNTNELSATDREVVELGFIIRFIRLLILKVSICDFNFFNVSKLTNQHLMCTMQDIWLKLGRRI